MAPGQLLEGKYQITRELGRGAMGVVYEAMHMSLGRRVAVKTLIEGTGGDVELGARFEREARAASAIGHPHIIDVFDLGRTKDGLLFMVMELLDGSPLEAILRKTPRLPLPLTIHLMTQVLSGLSAAHKNGIVHRDLKPDNIFVTSTEERPNFVKIVDFGISKVLGPKSGAPAGIGKFSGTMVGTVLGTPLYMSPEQAIGQVTAIDHRTDIYSAGVVLYEMLCGCTPFAGKSYPEVLGKILEGKFRKPSELRPDVPPEIEAAIVQALSRDIEARFPTAAAMRKAIAADPNEITLAPIPLAPPPRDAPGQPAPRPAPEVGDVEPIRLVDTTTAPRHPSKHAALPGGDPFAPPPDSAMAPLLAGDLDRSVVLRPGPAPRPRPEPERLVSSPSPDMVAPVRRSTAPARERAAPASEPWSPPASRRWVFVAGGLLAVAAVGAFAYKAFGPESKTPLLPRFGGSKKITLVVDPKEATVQIDHVPVTPGVLPLDASPGRTHKLNATAPGRITRRFTFAAKAGMTLAVRLSHTLGAPNPSDPPPLPGELAADYPESPRSAAEIDAAFARLARYDECLAMVAEVAGDGKKTGGRGRARDEEAGTCRLAISEGVDSETSFPELQTAGEAYLALSQKGGKPDVLARLAAAFRAEFLAARAAWQVEELSRVGKDEGQKAGWHMRRVALAAQTWMRSRKSSPPAPEIVDKQRARLDEAFSAFMQYVRLTPQALAQTSGATDFVAAAEEVVALANGAGGRKATEFSALDACRKLLNAFDALVVD